MFPFDDVIMREEYAELITKIRDLIRQPDMKSQSRFRNAIFKFNFMIAAIASPPIKNQCICMKIFLATG